MRIGSHRERHRHFIREWRKHRGYTQGQLAEMVGTSTATISRIEKLEQPYTQDLLELLSEALMVEPATLIMRMPGDQGSIWSLWERATPAQRQRLEEVANIMMRDGTND